MKDLESPFGVAVFEDYVYWSDSKGQKLYKANKFTGKDSTHFDETFSSPLGLDIYHPLLQKSGKLENHDFLIFNVYLQIMSTYRYMNAFCVQVLRG